jgi:hypothetical protein
MSQPEPNPALGGLSALVGEWEVESPLFPGAQGRAVFEWLEGGAYLMQHATAPDPAPNSTWIIGADDSAEDCSALYHDSRGVSRVYRTSFVDGIWTVSRDAPGFWQRFRGRLSEDATRIEGAWELSADGTSWEHDFDLTYTRIT